MYIGDCHLSVQDVDVDVNTLCWNGKEFQAWSFAWTLGSTRDSVFTGLDKVLYKVFFDTDSIIQQCRNKKVEITYDLIQKWQIQRNIPTSSEISR